ncbi:iron chaperone [Lapidilactobacillus mulanensis]|uniref:Iron chaperone n=1 Tax=Lapidilactobacillus mulanensis TaxID=2485999 RepID=A0ABW4DJV6_9LACO|nr:DUF1801 domain-containing protein [Lapidilactobacillus mulanensis]
MPKYSTLKEFLDAIPDVEHAAKLAGLIDWTLTEFPNLKLRMAWNQPMLTDHGTFIISYSVAKPHIAVAVEDKALTKFLPAINATGYKNTKKLFQIPWTAEIDYDLLRKLVQFNIDDKQDVETFWG